MGRPNFRVLLGLILGLCLWGSFSRAQEAVVPPDYIDTPSSASTGLGTEKPIWGSTARSASEFSAQLSNFYLSLYNTERLTVRIVQLEERQSIEDLSRKHSILLGPIFSLEVESLLCDLNEYICVRPKIQADASSDNLLGGTIRGFIPTKPVWNLEPSRPVALPALRLNKRESWIPFVKKPGDKIEEVVVHRLGGCTSFDEGCRQAILKLNRWATAESLADDFGGELLLPVIAATALFDSHTFQEIDQHSRGAQEILVSPTGSGNLKPINPGKGDLYKVSPPKEPNAPANIAVERLNSNPNNFVRQIDKNILGTFKPFRWSAGAAADTDQFFPVEKFKSERSSLSKLISFPFHKLEEYPPDLRGGHVGVFDSWVDDKHCALQGKRFKIANHSVYSDATEKNCDRMSPRAHEEVDHGTHVVGIIGARGAKDGEYGLNPYASIDTQEINFASLSDPATAEPIASKIVSLRTSSSVDVVNMSIGYYKTSRGVDPLEQAIATTNGSVLYVAAAGNGGSDKTNICDLRPACFDMPNVISVAALDRSPSPHLLSDADGSPITNYGTKIHIAAIGEKVFSTVSYGRYGYLSGTSQAAPQVTAVASLLMKRFEKLRPQEVKNRLIYASDLLPELSGKLFGGRLNAEWALDGRDGRIRLLTAPGAEPIRGRFAAGGLIHFQNQVSGRQIALPIESIRSLNWVQADSSWTVFYSEDKLNKVSRLLKEENLVLEKPDEKLKFIPITSPTLQLLVADIDRYVSPVE